LRDREYPDRNPGLPFIDGLHCCEAQSKEANDEDHISSGGTTARVIVRDAGVGSYADPQNQPSRAFPNLQPVQGHPARPITLL
jgi:hypothetical protein